MSEGEVLGCRACREGFSNAEEQRAHYRTDFHRFNLKRKVAGLPPVSRATFEAKFPQLQQQQQQQQAQEQPEPVVEAPPPKTEEELIQEKLNNAQVIPLSQCIFCRKPSRNFQKNMEHMTKEHGFFVPDLEYTTSLQGLVTYLSQKISVGNVCIYCNRAFQTMEAVQAHMVSVSHCKMYYSDDVDEYDEFYDFTKSYDDVVLPDDPAADAAPANEEEEKEKGDAHGDQEVEVEVESQVVVSEDGYSMQFKDGRTAGHRALTLYYRQKPKPTETRDSVLINTLMKQYQTLGMVTKYKKPHTSEVGNKGTQRRMQYHYVKLGVQSNKLSKYLHARTGDESI